LLPSRVAIIQINNSAGGTFFHHDERVGAKANWLFVVVSLGRAAVFDTPKINPRKIVSAVSESFPGAKNNPRCASSRKNNDAFFSRWHMLHKKGEIVPPVAIEIAAPHERIDACGEL
jgi:hypothetical protein